MHMLEWPSWGFWKQKFCENLCRICFAKFGSSKYNNWTIVPIACLSQVQGVDTTQAHIYYIYSLPNLSKTKFFANLVIGLRGSGNSGVFPGQSRFPRNSGPGPESLGCNGINTLYSSQRTQFTPFHSLTAPTPSLVASLSPPSSPWVIFFPPSKSNVSEGLRAPKCGDRRSTQDSKDWSLSLSLPKVSLEESLSIYFPRVVLAVSS
jgi:hypothetical protein